jgi:tRNA G18 (ribose-2'-O)-methylase SpoU
MIAIGDPADPRLGDYLELRDPVARARREGDELFIAEGLVAMSRLFLSRHRVRSVLVSERKVHRLAELGSLTDAPVYVATPDVIESVVGFDFHRGALAAADRSPLPALEELLATSDRLAVLVGLNDPENLGAIARSARALGVDGLVLDPQCADPYYRRVVRVSMGEILLLPVCRAQTWPGDLTRIADAGFETWAMTPAADAESIWDCSTAGRVAVVLGAEGPGLVAATIEGCTRRVRIPITPNVDSLNVGHAAAVAFAALAR